MLRGVRTDLRFFGPPVFFQLEMKAADEKWSIFCPFIFVSESVASHPIESLNQFRFFTGFEPGAVLYQ